MKKIIAFVSLSFFLSATGFSQTVNGIPLKDLQKNSEYIRIIQSPVLLANKIKIDIEYGQPEKRKNTEVVDLDGYPTQFNSIIEVLNLMSQYGYELIHSNDSVSVYLMKRKEIKAAGNF
jgi:hypothetical protein